MIEKAVDPKTSKFNIQEDWTPPPLKSGDNFFEDVDNPGKCPWY